MTENFITLKTVNEILGENFFIPAYQRGYRWTSQQVKDLLNDIAEFTPKENLETGEKTWYCLQPVIVKQIEDKWDVIDGQQRLTTIFLILNYLNQGYAENRRKRLFSLEYETRNGSEDFLKNRLLEENIDDTNIDYFFISSAYQTIANWFNDKGQNFDISNFESKFLFSTKVIWYEIIQNDAIEIFTRINLGKIPLTNAELIKALFLNSSNFEDKKDNSKIRLKQLEIASEWDRIEYALQDDSLWYFLNNTESDFATRIEYIFDLIADKPKEVEDEYFTFRYFCEKFKQEKEEEIVSNWQTVKKYFQTLEEWFSDRELYHKIGFLITSGTNLKDILRNKNNKTKLQFLDFLNKEILSKIDVVIEDLEYGNGKVRPILLFHNIQTMLNNREETNRFPFNRYKKEKWDVEHISAIAEEMPKTEQHQKDWLNEVKKHILDNPILLEKTETHKKDNFEDIFKEILNYFSENSHEDVNDISNLALLDARTNRSYKNAVFPVKRSTIIEREKEGTFIPICTKNVFMKFYSNSVNQMTFWGDADREKYLSDIINTINTYRQN
ncbi:DUF262 domain-containing protein [Empedobacter brevis]